jgi:hypothetical protein
MKDTLAIGHVDHEGSGYMLGECCKARGNQLYGDCQKYCTTVLPILTSHPAILMIAGPKEDMNVVVLSSRYGTEAPSVAF